MFKEKENYFYIEEFENYGIKAVYSKKNAGNMSDYCGMEGQEEGTQEQNRNKLLEGLKLKSRIPVMSFQTHTNNVQIIDKNTEEYIYREIDGFVTNRKDVALFTFYADCLPIFVYDKENKAIGVWHSGESELVKQSFKINEKTGKYHFDNITFNRIMALKLGIKEENLVISQENTWNEKFYSHRREGKKSGRATAMISFNGF